MLVILSRIVCRFGSPGGFLYDFLCGFLCGFLKCVAGEQVEPPSLWRTCALDTGTWLPGVGSGPGRDSKIYSQVSSTPIEWTVCLSL